MRQRVGLRYAGALPATTAERQTCERAGRGVPPASDGGRAACRKPVATGTLTDYIRRGIGPLPTQVAIGYEFDVN